MMNTEAATIRKGDLVTIRPEWLDANESAETLYVVHDEPEKGRVSIRPAVWEWPIVPIQTVEVRMLEVIQ